MFENLTSLDLSDRARTVLSNEAFQEYKVLEQDAGSSFSALKKISPELNDLYAVRAATELSSKMLNSELVRTVDEVKDYANMLHNTMSEARVTAINQASKTILNLYKKYGKDIEFYAIDYVNEEIRTKNLSENERRDLDDAFKVLALSKSYNKSLGLQLEMMFRHYDAIEASKDSTDDSTDYNKQSEENTTNSEAIADTITQNANNTTGLTIQGNTEQETQQSDENQPTIDPQETENRKPAYYAKFWFPNGVLSSSRHSNTDNGGAAVYDNNDGTFTLDVRDDKRALNDSRFFSNADEVDLTRPYEVVEKPILKKNKKGKLVMYKQGRLVNTDTLEYQAAQQQEQQEEQQVSQPNEQQEDQQNGEQSTGANGEQITKQSTNDAIETTTQPVEDNTESSKNDMSDNPSTGGVIGEDSQTTTTVAPQKQQTQQKSSTEATTSVYDDIIPDETTTEDEIRMSSLGRFQREFKANNDVDLDAIAKEIINTEVKKGQDRQVVEAAVNKSLAIIKRVIERKKGKASETTMKSSIDEVVVESSIVELTNKNPFVEDYTNAVKNMINEFCKELGINEYNGKKYINFEDLLRYVNTISNDSQMSNMMFDALKVYLNTDEAKTKFITTDETQNSDTLKKNIAKSAAQRYQERLSDTTTQRVNIWDLRNSLSSQKEIKEFEDAIEALNKGDKLTYTREDNKIVLKDTKGRTIGTLSIPRINSKTGAYEMTNDGWKYDILTQSGGTINSKLKALFSRWLNEVNDDCKELNAIIYELAFEKTSSERKKELLAKFIENKEIKAAKANGFIDNKAGNEKLINGLVKLWRYQSYSDGKITLSKNKRINNSLNSWFSKLRNSYDGVSYLINNTDGEIEVANISDGEIIRASETNGKKAALPANDAIAGGANPNIHKLASSSKTPNTLIVSGMPSINFSGVGKMNTFVLLPNRNGSYEYVHAYPAETTDDYIGKDAKEIVKAFQNRVLELLDNHSKNPTQESFNEVKDFIKSVLINYNGNSSLFWNLTVFEKNNVFGIKLNEETKIAINAKNGYIDVSKIEYELNSKNRRQKRMQLGTQEANTVIIELLNNLRFNTNPTYILSDNATNTILNGIAKRRNGKFEITIGDKTWSYDSYNAFVLNNNLVRLNTKPNKRGTSNFNPRGSRTQSANQVLEIRITNATSSPVESNAEQQQTVEPVVPNVKNISIPDKAFAILNGTQQSNHVGNDIAALVFNGKQLKALKDLELLPKNIIFDENFNKRQGYETINAEYNDTTKKIIVGTRWLNMFNNPTTRNQAIRKLIHEQLHYKLRKSKEYVRSVQSIYDEFKEYLDKNNVPKDAHIRAYLFENESTELRALEEFLVESLTSEELARYLNGIKTSVPTKRGAKNLWQKILMALSDIFGWKVTKGSLYEKELNTIRELKLSSETVEQNTETQTDNSESNVEQEDNNTDNNLPENSDNNLQENNKTDEEKIEVQDEETEETGESSDGFVDISDMLMGMFSSVTEQPVSQTKPVYTKEEQDILSCAPRNAKGQLLAPNGRVSNLTEKQYAQVRTKAFKDWFGDWEQLAYDKAALSSIPNLRKIDVDSFLKAVDSSLEKDYITTGFLNRESVEVIKKLFDLSKTKLYQGDIKGYGLSFYTGAIVLNTMPMEEAAQVFVHETLHSYTTYAYDTDADFRKEINKYHKIALSHNSGFSKDIYEFMANTLEPHHMVTLLNIPSENNSSNLLKDIINSFVKHIRAFFKAYETNKKRTLFHDVIETIYNHKRNNSESINNVSKVVDENSEPLVVYHGGSSAKIFNTKGGQFGAGIKKGDVGTYFTTSKSNAKSYEEIYTFKSGEKWITLKELADNGELSEEDVKSLDEAWEIEKPSTRAFFLNIRNPKITNYEGTSEKGYTRKDSNTGDNDGQHIIISDANYDEYVAFNPNQIKSATGNTGAFSNEDDDIYHSSVTEERITLMPNVPSVASISDMLPLEQQSKFDVLVASAEFETSCR